MALYLIALTGPDEGAWERLAEQWPNGHHIVCDQLAFASPPGVSTPETVRDAVGITIEPEAPSGIVVEIPAGKARGVLPSTTVEWLEAATDHS